MSVKNSILAVDIEKTALKVFKTSINPNDIIFILRFLQCFNKAI